MSATDTVSPGVIGQRMLRKEDPALLTGEARYTSDLALPGALHLAVVRCPCAHARIGAIDTSAASAMPGVVAVYTGDDLADTWAAPMPCAWPVTDDMKNPAHYPLARGKACYVGDGVAAVVATSAAAARDAAEAVGVDYEPLDAVVDLEDALSDRVVIHDDAGTNTSYTWALKVEDPSSQTGTLEPSPGTARSFWPSAAGASSARSSCTFCGNALSSSVMSRRSARIVIGSLPGARPRPRSMRPG